jgi:hypothetical protein
LVIFGVTDGSHSEDPEAGGNAENVSGDLFSVDFPVDGTSHRHPTGSETPRLSGKEDIHHKGRTIFNPAVLGHVSVYDHNKNNGCLSHKMAPLVGISEAAALFRVTDDHDMPRGSAIG